MSGHLPVIDNLRRTGHRITPQRAMILEAMVEHGGHMSAEEVYRRVHARHPYVNRSTVYRTLEMLSKQSLATVTDLGTGAVHYELHSDEPHHHLVCQGCGQIEELDHTLLEPLQKALSRKYKFKANIEHFAIFGLCRHCQAKLNKTR